MNEHIKFQLGALPVLKFINTHQKIKKNPLQQQFYNPKP